MEFVDGLMIHSGDPVNYYVDTAAPTGRAGPQSEDLVSLGLNW